VSCDIAALGGDDSRSATLHCTLHPRIAASCDVDRQKEPETPPVLSCFDGMSDALPGMVPAVALTSHALWTDADEDGRRSIGTVADTPALP